MKEKVQHVRKQILTWIKLHWNNTDSRILGVMLILIICIGYLSLISIEIKHALDDTDSDYKKIINNQNQIMLNQKELMRLHKKYIEYSVETIENQEDIIDKYKSSTIMLDKEYVIDYMKSIQPKMYDKLAEEIYDEIIILEEIYGLYPGTLLFIMDVESDFDVNAKSNMNAIGLMQVHVPTWTKKLTELGILSKDNHLYNPRVNLRAGAYIINHYIDKHKGDYNKAFKAYFGGNFDSYYNKILKAIGTYYIHVSGLKNPHTESSNK